MSSALRVPIYSGYPQHDATARHALRARRGESGQSIIEFALVVPIIFLMLVGVVYIAQGFNLQMVLAGAAYEGARVWAKDPAGGGPNHCTPPACDPTNQNEGHPRNFEAYVVPAVKRYLRTNGFDGELVRFFSSDADKYEDYLQYENNQRETVRITIFYPFNLPIGSFAESYQQVWISATCTMKRGS